jgi:hypothetical protein
MQQLAHAQQPVMLMNMVGAQKGLLLSTLGATGDSNGRVDDESGPATVVSEVSEVVCGFVLCQCPKRCSGELAAGA